MPLSAVIIEVFYYNIGMSNVWGRREYGPSLYETRSGGFKQLGVYDRSSTDISVLTFRNCCMSCARDFIYIDVFIM